MKAIKLRAGHTSPSSREALSNALERIETQSREIKTGWSAGMTDSEDDQPRSMRDAGVRERRRAMLGNSHMIELTSLAKKLRRPGLEVPDFDPLDGGVKARALFLFEKPGPMTAVAGRGKRSGSGFISRDNNDQTVQPSSLTIELEAGLNGFDAKIGQVHVARGDLRLQAEYRPHYVHQLG